MIIRVDPGSSTPPYEQIRAQLATMIEAGTLAAGTQLPPVRQLAADLGLATNTVARAYRELELEGLVVSRVRHGTTVAARPALGRSEIRRRIDEAAHAYAALAPPARGGRGRGGRTPTRAVPERFDEFRCGSSHDRPVAPPAGAGQHCLRL